MNIESVDNQQAIEVLRSGNMELASKLKTLIHRTIDKANEMVDKVETVAELNMLVRTAEIAAKSLGLAPTESVSNVTINAISGFEFYIEAEAEPTKQMTINDVYREVV